MTTGLPTALTVTPELKRFLDLLEKVADAVELLYQLGAAKDARELETRVMEFLEHLDAPKPSSEIPFPAPARSFPGLPGFPQSRGQRFRWPLFIGSSGTRVSLKSPSRARHHG